MRARRVVALVLFLLVLPVVFVGLIDPLEGGIALLLALGIYAAGFLLARQKPARYLWIPFVVAIGVGAATLALAVVNLEFTSGPSDLPPVAIVGLWLYRVAVIASLVGGIITVWASATALRAHNSSPQAK